MDQLHARIIAAQEAIAHFRDCPRGDIVCRENRLNEVSRQVEAFYEEAKKEPGFLERVLAKFDKALATK